MTGDQRPDRRLEQTLRELHAIQEDLRAQNEELLANRADLEAEQARLEGELQRQNALVQQAIRALIGQSRRLDAFFEHTLTPLVFLDDRFNFLRVNRAYAEACDRQLADFEGRNHFDLYPHPENQAIFEQVVRSRKPHAAVAKPFSYPDHPEWGETYWNWTLVPILDAAGRVEFLVFSLQDVTDRMRAEQELSQRAAQLQELTVELARVEQRERDRLSSLLHDGLQQMLAGAKFHLERLRSRAGEDLRADLQKLETLLAESVAASRSLAHDLSPPVLAERRLAAGIEWLIEWFARHQGLAVELRGERDVLITDPDTRLVVFNAVRELLFNAVKHSGTKQAVVELVMADSGELRVTVSDRGRGIGSVALGRDRLPAAGFGLRSIRERLRALGGDVLLEDQDPSAGGTRVTLVLRPGERIGLQAGPAPDRPAS